MNCPKCSSEHIVKNGSRQNGKQNFKCLPCGRQFVENPSKHYKIPQETRDLVDRLLLEKISLAGIARATQVSERWLQYYVNDKYEAAPQEVIVKPKKKYRLTAECDEMWSFVGNKKTSGGFGWPSTGTLVKSSGFMWVAEIVLEHKPCGTACLQFTANALFVIQISGMHTK